MSAVEIYVKGAKLTDVRKAVEAALEEVDKGVHDTALEAAGYPRPSGTTFKGSFRLSQGQGLAPQDWLQIIGDFAPLAVMMGRTVWTIAVVPRLKRLFHEDRVSEHDPQQKRGTQRKRGAQQPKRDKNG
jgi:hypothetical protein